jgi:hypothetical protein
VSKHRSQGGIVAIMLNEFKQAGNGVIPQARFGIPINRISATGGPGTGHIEGAGFIQGEPLDHSACHHIS